MFEKYTWKRLKKIISILLPLQLLHYLLLFRVVLPEIVYSLTDFFLPSFRFFPLTISAKLLKTTNDIHIVNPGVISPTLPI